MSCPRLSSIGEIKIQQSDSDHRTVRYSFFRELITKAFILAGALCSSFLGLSDFEDQKWTLLWFRKLEDFLVTANSLHKNFTEDQKL